MKKFLILLLALVFVFMSFSCDNQNKTIDGSINAVDVDAVYFNDFSNSNTTHDFCPCPDVATNEVEMKHEGFANSLVFENGRGSIYKESAWRAFEVNLDENNYELSYDVTLNMADLEVGAYLAFDAGSESWENSFGLNFIKSKDGILLSPKQGGKDYFDLKLKGNETIHVSTEISLVEEDKISYVTSFITNGAEYVSQPGMGPFAGRIYWDIYEVIGNGDKPIGYLDNFMFKELEKEE